MLLPIFFIEAQHVILIRLNVKWDETAIMKVALYRINYAGFDMLFSASFRGSQIAGGYEYMGWKDFPDICYTNGKT